MVEAPSVEQLADHLRSGVDQAGRAALWHGIAAALAGQGRRGQALLAARTALALHERAGSAQADRRGARAAVELLSGPDVVPLHVAVGAAGGSLSGADEARAVWLGAPADPVLAMLGWVERDGTIDVVRVVVPGTRRGRSAFSLLLAALPTFVPVSLRLPARDRSLVGTCTRAGFGRDGGPDEAGGHVGGTARLHRPAAVVVRDD